MVGTGATGGGLDSGSGGHLGLLSAGISRGGGEGGAYLSRPHACLASSRRETGGRGWRAREEGVASARGAGTPSTSRRAPPRGAARCRPPEGGCWSLGRISVVVARRARGGTCGALREACLEAREREGRACRTRGAREVPPPTEARPVLALRGARRGFRDAVSRRRQETSSSAPITMVASSAPTSSLRAPHTHRAPKDPTCPRRRPSSRLARRRFVPARSPPSCAAPSPRPPRDASPPPGTSVPSASARSAARPTTRSADASNRPSPRRRT